jgi:hypothetical protein
MSANVVKADAKFLRRVLLTLVGLTMVTGVLAGVTAVHAMNVQNAEISGN